MSEREPNQFENEPEHIPSPEEVRSIFRELSEKEFVETKRVDDEKGLVILEVEVAGETEGQVIEYAYRRTLRHLQGAKTEFEVPEIHTTVYEDGMPVRGTSAARYVEGGWKIL
jgi:hypothetical protein